MRNGWSLHDTCIVFRGLHRDDPGVRISKNQVLQYELGQTFPRADRIAQLAELFGVNPNFFFTTSNIQVRERMGPDYDKVLKSISERGPTVIAPSRPGPGPAQPPPNVEEDTEDGDS